MTVRSKQTPKAEIVALPSIRQSAAGRSVSLRSRPEHYKPGVSATLVSIREHLSIKASVGFIDIDSIRQRYSPQVAEKLMANIRELLDCEFGHLRVYRRHQVFVVRHHSMESLIAGLLTVQFHSCQISLPVTCEGNGTNDLYRISLSWGIGRSRVEAERERRRKQNG